jgi:prepilin-type N-terminal cleavage/methylation domain-containing protein/prepilin-type processing-associated H-X9-DG protein
LVGGFTVIELLVVVAIIALLMAILLPSLQKARAHAKTVLCSSNLHHVGLAMGNYLYISDATYPASYLYPKDDDGSWSVEGMTAAHPHGYLHWSYFMYGTGEVGDKAFQCPMMEHGGAPRTNPGLELDDWEAGQVDQNGDGKANELTDKQARRISYVANAAIVPRNKFTRELSGGPRTNVFVKENRVPRPGNTILATEFLDNWKAIGVRQGSGILSKSHRPINVLYHIGSGFNEYTASVSAPGFIYGLPDDQETYGLMPFMDVREKVNILDYTSGMSQINAVGRHHPCPDPIYRGKYGGTANFLFCDTHVENMTALKSVHERKWGDRYYGISGANEILNMSSDLRGFRR